MLAGKSVTQDCDRLKMHDRTATREKYFAAEDKIHARYMLAYHQKAVISLHTSSLSNIYSHAVNGLRNLD